MGSVLKFLFGTMDDDYQNLNLKLEQLENDGKSIVHVEADRLTYMRKLTNEVDGNSKAIQLLVQSLKSTVTEINNVTFSIYGQKFNSLRNA